MCRNPLKTGSRSAFTLVEMVVVLLIIAILASLVTSVVVSALNRITEVQTRTEISELETALRAFMTDYGLSDPPPSKLFLNEFSPLSSPSSPFLQKVFGKNLGPTDWNGDGTIAPANVTWILEGEQCLVFYLGGITPLVAGMGYSPQGFSTNNMNPSVPSGKRKGPYYTFNTSRLVSLSQINPLATPMGGISPFPVYLDPWQVKPTTNAWQIGPVVGGGPMPYVYFSSSGNNNGYNYFPGPTPAPGISDCQYVWSGWVSGVISPSPMCAVPYGTGNLQYTYSNTYQIISAGRDGVFGYNQGFTAPLPGTSIVPSNYWLPTSGATGSGADDQANFSSTLLGKGQN